MRPYAVTETGSTGPGSGCGTRSGPGQGIGSGPGLDTSPSPRQCGGTVNVSPWPRTGVECSPFPKDYEAFMAKEDEVCMAKESSGSKWTILETSAAGSLEGLDSNP